MIAYLDTSAIVKQYIVEPDSSMVRVFVQDHARIVGVSMIARPEVSATFSKAVRTGFIWKNIATTALQQFRADWNDLRVLALTEEIVEEIVEEADQLAWAEGLRGSDAIHLATALFWQHSIHESIVFATFDRKLWQSAQQVGLEVWPKNLA